MRQVRFPPFGFEFSEFGLRELRLALFLAFFDLRFVLIYFRIFRVTFLEGAGLRFRLCAAPGDRRGPPGVHRGSAGGASGGLPGGCSAPPNKKPQ